MATQQMFYESVSPLSSQRHGDLCVDRGKSYEFAKSVSFVPLMAVEIPHAAREYTIVFIAAEETVVLGALIGVDGKSNLYLNEDGEWDAQYVPAYVRRYPFVFAKAPEQEGYLLAIDENWAGCNREGRGERIFDEQGKPTEYVQNVLNFLKDYQRQAEVTQRFSQRLKELDLLDPKQVQFTSPDGRPQVVKGVMAVDRERLKKLPAETLAELANTNFLELTYAHLLSLNNISLVINRAAKHHSKTVEPAVEEAPVEA